MKLIFESIEVTVFDNQVLQLSKAGWLFSFFKIFMKTIRKYN